MKKIMVFLGIFSILMSCTQSISTHEVKPQSRQDQRLSGLGRFVKMVPLETHDDALLGEVKAVEVCPKTGDILVSDTRIGKAVYRFSPDGKFRYKYGQHGKGPGEYEELTSFTVMENGNVALMTQSKRMLFSLEGELLIERKSGLNDFFTTAMGDLIYVYSINGWENVSHMISVLDQNLDEVASFHPYEHRIDNAPYIPIQALAKLEGDVVVSHFTDFELSFYGPQGEPKHRVRFPNENYKIEATWDRIDTQKPGDMEEAKKLFNALRRSHAVHGVGNLLHILESQPGKDLLRSIIWDSDNQRATMFTNIRLVRAPADANYLSMSDLIGSYDKGLIGVCTDPDLFARFQDRYPFAAQVDYKDADNPVLLFFELNQPQTSLAQAERNHHER